MGLAGELAREISREYEEEMRRGRELGPLASLVEAVEGPTSKMRQDLTAIGASLQRYAPIVAAVVHATTTATVPV